MYMRVVPDSFLLHHGFQSRQPIMLMKKIFWVFCGFLALAAVRSNAADTNPPPVRIAIWGLVHAHVHGFIPKVLARPDVQLAGIIEPDRELAARCAREYHLSPDLFHPSLEDLLAK